MPVFGVGWSITSDEEILRREPNDQHYYLASVEAAQNYVGIGADFVTLTGEWSLALRSKMLVGIKSYESRPLCSQR